MIRKIASSILVLNLSACGAITGTYDATTSRPILVKPTVAWFRVGATWDEAQASRDACGQEARKHPTYVALKKMAKETPMSKDGWTDQQREVVGAPSGFAGTYIKECMKNKGFKYGKLPKQSRPN